MLSMSNAEMQNRLSLVSPKVFFSVLLPTEFWFLAVVASGLLSWGHFISSDITDLIAQILFKLNDDITEFNNEMPLTQKCSYFDIVQLL